MRLIRYDKKVVLFIFFVVVVFAGIFYSGEGALAATTVNVSLDSNNAQVCWDRSTGNYLSTYNGTDNRCNGQGKDQVKLIGDDYAYCVNWNLLFRSAPHKIVTSWSSKSKNAIMAGYLINYINSQSFSWQEAYAKTGATLNTFFASYVNDSSSKNFSSNSEIKSYINEAERYYKTVNLNDELPNVSLSMSNKVLSYNDTSKKYFSGKITASGFVSTYGGDNDTVTYNISATASNGKTVDICTNSRGTNCDTSISLSGITNDYSFYLFIDKDKISSSDTITVKVTGSNKSVYYSSVLYENVSYEDAQKLLVIDEFSVSRNVSESLVVTIPDLVGHKIYAYKVDENGDILNGATLEIYKDDPNVSSNLLATNNGSGFSVTYVPDEVVYDKDDFFNHDYYLVERRAPVGYVFSSVNKFYLKGTSSDDGISCYYNGGSESGEMKVVDVEYCYPENYEYKCQNTAGEIIGLNESGNCEFQVMESDGDNENESNTTENEELVPVNEETITEGVDNIIEGEIIEDSNETTETPNEDGTKTVTYPKVCYNNKNRQVVDESYCSNKDSYTRVQNANGNIVIRQTNSRNVVRISKQDVTGDKEISGANLKVCTKVSYESKGIECDSAKTVDNKEMNWISGDEPHNIYGVPVGNYYIIEVTPPRGYIRATIATPFSIDEKGQVHVGNKTITNEEFVNKTGVIVIKNELSRITISKQDVATSKELPGAVISICRSYLDNNNKRQMLVDQYTGDCIEATLSNGNMASWVSGDEAKLIVGLDAGTYYLVEKMAPLGYTTAESVLFTLKSDGTLVDESGSLLKGNKLIMYDEIIVEVKTGLFSNYMVGGILVIVVGLGLGSYYYLNRIHKNLNSDKVNDVFYNKRIRKRKIHRLKGK